ncbi:MAG: hypothetical protein GY847_37530 [Proteobacteria bacterium]|nr:hypothetical protein [Pseudomonadota bacterium]
MKIVFFVLTAIVGSCSPGPVSRYVVLVVEVADLSDSPVAGTNVVIDGISMGATDESGRLKARLSGPEGRHVRVQINCPDRWEAQGEEIRDLPIRFLSRLDSPNKALASMDARFRCVQKMRKIVLLVRAENGPKLPVLALGHRIVSTDADGVAQTVLEGAPGDEIEVILDTSFNPELRPAMPSRRLTIPKMSQIVVFDQQFERRQAIKKAKRRRRKRVGPRRI